MTPLTTDEVWEFYQELPEGPTRRLRTAAVRKLVAPDVFGISSSDVNHTAVGMLRTMWLVFDRTDRPFDYAPDEAQAMDKADPEGGRYLAPPHGFVRPAPVTPPDPPQMPFRFQY